MRNAFMWTGRQNIATFRIRKGVAHNRNPNIRLFPITMLQWRFYIKFRCSQVKWCERILAHRNVNCFLLMG